MLIPSRPDPKPASSSMKASTHGKDDGNSIAQQTGLKRSCSLSRVSSTDLKPINFVLEKREYKHPNYKVQDWYHKGRLVLNLNSKRMRYFPSRRYRLDYPALTNQDTRVLPGDSSRVCLATQGKPSYCMFCRARFTYTTRKTRSWWWLPT